MMENARYLYCVVRTGEQHSLGDIGIDDEEVYTIPHGSIAAIVHRCRPEPYNTDDKFRAEGWILEHNYVIDQATNLFGTVLPFAFDVIIRGDDSVITGWLNNNYDHLKEDLERVNGTAEYSISIYCSFEDLAERVWELSPELKISQNETAGQPAGKAYLLQKRLELKRKDLMSRETNRLKEQIYTRIKPLAKEIKVEGKKGRLQMEDKKMELVASCNCLVCDENVKPLGEVLDQIQEENGFAIKFTGPWAPFNFVNFLEDRGRQI